MTIKSLTPISDAELLEEVKASINLSGNNYQDKTISFWIDEVKRYILQAGVSADVVGSTLAKGCIAQGVNDLWGNGGGVLSDYFYQSASQLRNYKFEPDPEPEQTNNVLPTPQESDVGSVVVVDDDLNYSLSNKGTFAGAFSLKVGESENG